MPTSSEFHEKLAHEIGRMIDLKKGKGRKDYLEGLHQGFLLIESFAPSALKKKSLAELKEKFDDVWLDEGD
jgi:hypothetical protein